MTVTFVSRHVNSPTGLAGLLFGDSGARSFCAWTLGGTFYEYFLLHLAFGIENEGKYGLCEGHSTLHGFPLDFT